MGGERDLVPAVAVLAWLLACSAGAPGQGPTSEGDGAVPAALPDAPVSAPNDARRIATDTLPTSPDVARAPDPVALSPPPADAGEASATPPGIPAGYQLQIDEPFSSPASLDRLVFGAPADWRFQAAEGGSLETFMASYKPPYRSPDTVAVVASKRVGSFVLEVEIMETARDLADPHRDFCVLFNVQSPSRFYYAHISARHDATSAHHIQIVNDAARRPITRTFTPGYDWGTNVWHKLRVLRDVASGAIEVRDVATDKVLLTANDRTFTDGYVGFGSIGDAGRVRRLRVWAPSAVVAAPGFFQKK
jgi:hypothetical protein